MVDLKTDLLSNDNLSAILETQGITGFYIPEI